MIAPQRGTPAARFLCALLAGITLAGAALLFLGWGSALPSAAAAHREPAAPVTHTWAISNVAPVSVGRSDRVFDDDGPHSYTYPDPDDEVRLIVEWGDLTGLEDLSGLSSVQVHRRFSGAFNGAAVAARAGDREAIARAPGVRAVYPDLPLYPHLSESVPQVGAPDVWALQDGQGRPVRGEGVRVAVIDTGIDHDHPALGGPGYPNARVIDGYNFVSDTLDPADDMGHGTHVAGVVGAAGEVTGVAPAVQWLAYKVVDAGLGYALTSDTIAAIERALDPDGDPLTNDGAQVINISLGASGAPNAPLERACDAAAAAGAVVVLAAGNGGPGAQTLTTPGLSGEAVTVGAVDKEDGLWRASSRGPVPSTWAIKPDLVAPGVSVRSTYPGGGTIEGTGTSVSAPHVAGAAALLRQLYPDWPQAWVKAALMNTALDLGLSPYEQGAGRLQADRAAVTPALIQPPSLSLGRVEGSLPLWTRQEAVEVRNVSAAAVSYTLSVAASLPAGITATLSATRVVVAPGGTVPVTLTLLVDTALAPDAPEGLFAYWGALLAAPDDASAPALRAPWALIKAPLLRLTLSPAPAMVMMIHDDPLTSRYAWQTVTTADHLLPARSYSVAVELSDPLAYVVRGVTLGASGYAELEVGHDDAPHAARIAFLDQEGRPVSPTYALHRFMWGGNGWLSGRAAGGEPISGVTYFSDVPPQFVWERTAIWSGMEGERAVYRQWHGRAEGIAGDLVFTPADPVVVDHPPRPQVDAGAYALWEGIGYSFPWRAYTFGPAAAVVSAPFSYRAYYQAAPEGHALYAARTLSPSPLPDLWAGRVASPWLQVDGEGALRWSQPFGASGGAYWRAPDPQVEPLGLGPAHGAFGVDSDAPDQVRLIPAEGRSLFYRAYQGGDVSWHRRQPYELWQDGALAASGDLGESTGSSGAAIDLPRSGAYSLTLSYTYTLGALDPAPARGRVEVWGDSRRSDAAPPVMLALRLLSGGRPTDVASGPVEVRLGIRDRVDPAPAVEAAYDAGAGWTDLPVVGGSGVYTASLPALPDGTAVRLRVSARDAAGNELVHLLDPAYLVRWSRIHLPLAARAP